MGWLFGTIPVGTKCNKCPHKRRQRKTGLLKGLKYLSCWADFEEGRRGQEPSKGRNAVVETEKGKKKEFSLMPLEEAVSCCPPVKLSLCNSQGPPN